MSDDYLNYINQEVDAINDRRQEQDNEEIYIVEEKASRQ